MDTTLRLLALQEHWNERLRKALKWYGHLYRTTEELLNDNGRRANEALAADKQEG